jgi:hypothetical protein
MKKLELLERMMATESTESEVLRQQYFNWKNQRTNTTSFSSKKLLSEVARYNKDIKGLESRRDVSIDKVRRKESMNRFDSTSTFVAN